MGTHPIFESDFDCLTEYRSVGMNETTNVPIPQSEHLNASNPFDDSSRSPATPMGASGNQQPNTPQHPLTPGNTPNLMSPPSIDPSQQMPQGGPGPGAPIRPNPHQGGIQNPSFHPNIGGMNGPMSNMNGQSAPPWQMMYQNRPPHMMGPGVQRMPDMSGRMGMHGGMPHGMPPGQPGGFPSFPGQPGMGRMSGYGRAPFGDNGPRGMNPGAGSVPHGMNGPSSGPKSETDSMVPNEILALLDNDSTTPATDKPKIEPVQCGVCQSQVTLISGVSIFNTRVQVPQFFIEYCLVYHTMILL